MLYSYEFGFSISWFSLLCPYFNPYFTLNFYFHTFSPSLFLWQNRLFPEVSAGGRGSISGSGGEHSYHILAKERGSDRPRWPPNLQSCPDANPDLSGPEDPQTLPPWAISSPATPPQTRALCGLWKSILSPQHPEHSATVTSTFSPESWQGQSGDIKMSQ